MATPKDRASEPSRKLVMDKSKLMPALGTPEEETVRGFRQKQGKKKFAEIQGMTAPRQAGTSLTWKESIGGDYHEGERKGNRLPATMPAEQPKSEVIKKEKPLKKSAAAPKPAFETSAAKRAWYINNGLTPPE